MAVSCQWHALHVLCGLPSLLPGSQRRRKKVVREMLCHTRCCNPERETIVRLVVCISVLSEKPLCLPLPGGLSSPASARQLCTVLPGTVDLGTGW